VSFSGSMNETMNALDPRFNSEEISVFRSWNPGQREYVENHARTFKRLWSGETGSSTVICSLPEAIEEGLNIVMGQFDQPPTTAEEAELVAAFSHAHVHTNNTRPRVPAAMRGAPFLMQGHQLGALRAWSENGYNGILELATGAGKTITAIYA